MFMIACPDRAAVAEVCSIGGRVFRWLLQSMTLTVLAAHAAGTSEPASAPQSDAMACIAPVSYHALPSATVGEGADGLPALGTYERISPDGRFVLRSYSGARTGKVSLIELPSHVGEALRVYVTPLSNEAFPVQGSWRYLVDVNGEHYRFSDILASQAGARPLFQGGMTGFYAAASEMDFNPEEAVSLVGRPQDIVIRSLSWPQGDAEAQGTGPLQIRTIRVHDDGRDARVVQDTGPQFVCTARDQQDGNVYALPMIAIDGSEFSAIPQMPRVGRPSMRVYGLATEAFASSHACELRADLGYAPGKAVFGFPDSRRREAPGARAALTYTDNASIYFYDRAAEKAFLIDEYHRDVLASAFPGLTRDGRIVAGATWKDCRAGRCRAQAGYVVADPYQSQAWLGYWRERGLKPPRSCITEIDVMRERSRFARQHRLPP